LSIPQHIINNAQMFSPTKGSTREIKGDPDNPKFYLASGIIGTECIIYTQNAARLLLGKIMHEKIYQPLDYILNEFI
jgi:hypothetical protein